MDNFFSPYLLKTIDFEYDDFTREAHIIVKTTYTFTDKNTRLLAEKLCHFYRGLCYDKYNTIIIKIVNFYNNSNYRTFVFNYLNEKDQIPFIKYEKF